MLHIIPLIVLKALRLTYKPIRPETRRNGKLFLAHIMGDSHFPNLVNYVYIYLRFH